MSFGKNNIAVAVSAQSEIDFLKSELEYHVDMIEEASKEVRYHTLKAQSVMKEIEAHEGR